MLTEAEIDALWNADDLMINVWLGAPYQGGVYVRFTRDDKR